MPRTDDTPPPLRIRRCAECRCPVTSHSELCAIGRSQRAELERIRREANNRVLTMYAHRRRVRALTVRAAERTMRGVAECGFTYFAGTPLSEEPTTRRRRK